MSFELPLSSSIFTGGWTAGTNDRGDAVLTRSVRVGEKNYKMSVGYNRAFIETLDDPTQAERTIQKIIEQSERQIAAFIETYAQQNHRSFSLSIGAGIEERTASVATRTLAQPALETKTPLKDLQLTRSAEFFAAAALIRQLSQAYLQLQAGVPERTIDKPRSEGTTTLNLPEGPSTFNVAFEEIDPAVLYDPTEEQQRIASEVLSKLYSGEIRPPERDINGKRVWQIALADGRQVEVNEFRDGAYNGPTKEVFAKRQQLVLEAAVRATQELSLRHTEKVATALIQLDQKFQKNLAGSAYEVNKMTSEEEFKEINDRALDLIAQFAKDCQHLINAALPSGKFTMNDLDALERQVVMDRGRPIVLNTFFIGGEHFFSMQVPETKEYDASGVPVYGKTIPSTLRDRQGLCNYVSTSFGKMTAGQEPAILYTGIRHSSYPPIAIEDPYLRQKFAVDNFKQGARDLAYKMHRDNPRETSPENPMEIPLRTMMLFTPVKGDFMRNKSKGVVGEWIGESEVTQLEESLLALRIFSDRPMPLQIGAETVWVRIDSSMMNLGANPEAAGIGPFGKLPAPWLQTLVNARGFSRFLDDTEAYIEQLDLPEDVKRCWRELQALEKAHTDQKKELNGVAQARKKYEPLLQQQYAELEALLEAYPQTHDAARIKKLQKNIMDNEVSLAGAYLSLVKNHTKAYKANELLIKQAEGRLRDAISKAKGSADAEQLREFVDLHDSFQLAKKIFYEKAYKTSSDVMTFQSIYIQMQSKMKRHVEFFCKSAEDRTGRVDDKVQEREVFYALKGRYPVSAKDYDELNQMIAPLVHQFSTSQNNTEYNSNARGQQIQAQVNPELPADQDRLNGTLAKRVIGKACKLEASPTVLHMIQNQSIAVM